jgi:beta-lactamase superfamily II metal-dependent hydrolase
MKPNNRLEVHFLNVDHGDCTIIRHTGDEHRKKGRISFIDINDWKDKQPDENEELIAGLSNSMNGLDENSPQSEQVTKQIDEEEYAEKYLDDPLEHFRSEVAEQGQDIWRFICTHPDMDHLSGLNRLVEFEDISVFWDVDHNKQLSRDDDWPPQYNTEDWEQYEQIRNGETDYQYLQPSRGSQKQYWDDDNMEILHPSPEFVQRLNHENEDKDNPEYNNASYVIKLNTRGGAILLPGDAEEKAWDEIFDRWGAEKLEDVKILKASHHGRDDGFHSEAVEAMDPEYVILSVGAKPNTDAHQKYSRVCSDDTKIWSTRQYGSISFTIAKRSGSVIPSRSVPEGIFNLPGE